MIRPTWAEINLGAVRRNVRRLVKMGNEKGLALIAVVKANGYGHGASRIAREALAAGACGLAVATAEEGIALRKAGVSGSILVMGAYVPGTAKYFAAHDLTATLTHSDQADAFVTEARALGGRFKVQLKVDTGMGRLGVLPADVEGLAMRVMDSHNISIEGVFSHLATADEPNQAYTAIQLEKFEGVLRHLHELGIFPEQRHILNSAGFMQHPPGSTNVARIGLAIYGVHPAPHLRSTLDLEPVMTFRTRVVAVKDVPAGTSVSYGCRYQTRTDTKLAALPVGYADGLSRQLSHKISVVIQGKRFPVVGSICMDQAIVDVGEGTVKPGDDVILFGVREQDPRPQEWADALETIVYEIFPMISARVPRLYLDDEGLSIPVGAFDAPAKT